MTRRYRENSSHAPRQAAAEQPLAAELSRNARLARIAALMSSCATAGLLAACGGGGADAQPQATATTAVTGGHGRVAIQAAAATVPATATPLVASGLGACTEAVSSSWDLKVAACNASAAQNFTLAAVSGSSGVYTI